MNEEFQKILESDEKVLHISKAYVNKVEKRPLDSLVAILMFGIFWYIMLKFKEDGFNIDYWLIFFVLIIFTVLVMYGIIYNICLKYKNKENEYLVTDKKVAVYNKKGLVSRRISEIERIGITNEKGKYANLIFYFESDSLLESIKSTIAFEGVENPRDIINSIMLKNEAIIVYDDRSEIMGRKI